MSEMLKTRIVATLGPASSTEAAVKRLIEAGVNIFRFNFSHDDPNAHLERLKMVRSVAEKLKANIALMQDLPGPKIRVEDIPDEGIVLKAGSAVRLTTEKSSGGIRINYDKLSSDVKPGHAVLLDDGKIRLKVLSKSSNSLVCRIESGGILFSRKGVNFPDSKLQIAAPTRNDLKLLKFGLEAGFDFTAVSFVRSQVDIKKVKSYIKRQKGETFIIAKIEKIEAVENIDSIIECSDGIMVARGDLGVELPIEDVPGIQRMIIDKCNNAGKPVITATEMLDSMITRPGPTRAEATDVANAVLNGTDALMLSGETAIGKYPIEAVRILRKIAAKAENDVLWRMPHYRKDMSYEIDATISRAAVDAARRLNASLIMTPTRSGKTARLISRFKPGCPIIAFCESDLVLREMAISWGVIAYKADRDSSYAEFIDWMIDFAHQNRLAKRGDLVVITSGSPNSKAGKTNLLVAERI